MEINEALGEFLETLSKPELRRVIARGHMMQVEYRERLVELAEGLVVAEKLLTQGDEEQPPVQAGG
jgi:hypothetical protein